MKNVLITGGSKRIGKSISKFLATKGYNICVHYNNSENESLKLVNNLRSFKIKCERIKFDLGDTTNLKNFYDKILEKFGEIHLLINNASVFEYDSLKTSSLESLDKHLNVNFKAPFFLSKYFSKSLGKNQNGLIINIIDQRVNNITPYFTSYTISKSALWTLTRSLALSLAPNIRVNAIGPGPTIKSLRQNQKQFKDQINRTPLKVKVDLDHINSGIEFFIKSKSVTGQIIMLDSGQNLGWANTTSKKFIDD